MNRRQLLLGAVAVVGVAACGDKRAILTDPIGASAYGYQMANLATNLPRGNVNFKFHATPAAVTPESLIVTLSGIDSLSSGFYTAWVGDSLGTTFKRITGLLTAIRTDSSLDAIGNVLATRVPLNLGSFSAIQNGNPRTAYTWAFERNAAGLAATDSMVTFVISIESSNAATTPNATRRPLYARRNDIGSSGSAGNRNSALKFGNYASDPVNQYVYSSAPARGRGVVWGEILQVTDSTLAVPPMGYYYATYLIKFVPPGSTNGDTLFLGDLTSPYPRRNLSLYNADSVNTDPAVVVASIPAFPQNREILAGSTRISADTIAHLPSAVCSTNDPGDNRPCPYKGFTEVRLTLESKNAARGRMGPNRVLGANVPFVITSGQYK